MLEGIEKRGTEAEPEDSISAFASAAYVAPSDRIQCRAWLDWHFVGWIDILERDSVALIGIYDGFVDMDGRAGAGAYCVSSAESG